RFGSAPGWPARSCLPVHRRLPVPSRSAGMSFGSCLSPLKSGRRSCGAFTATWIVAPSFYVPLAPPVTWSRSTFLRTLPVDVLGNSANTTLRGALYEARLALQYAMMSASVTSAPFLRVTNAHGVSPHFSWAWPRPRLRAPAGGGTEPLPL